MHCYRLSRGMATKTPSSSSRICLCSPTNHPGSFRCSLHRAPRKASAAKSSMVHSAKQSKMMAMMLATSKISLLKAFLMQIINPSSHDLQRRRNFQPRPTRFCLMNSNNGDHHGVAVSWSLESSVSLFLIRIFVYRSFVHIHFLYERIRFQICFRFKPETK